MAQLHDLEKMKENLSNNEDYNYEDYNEDYNYN